MEDDTIVLEHFPRPPADTGRGVHWSHSQYFWGKQDWGFWKEQLQAMHIKWVKILDDGDGSAEGLVKRLVDIKIMPVVRFYKEEPNPGRISGREADTARRYAEIGAAYFETNNEPDLDLEWKGRRRPPNWLDIVVENFIIEADMIRNAGGYLLFPAFGPGGRGNPFKLIVEKGRKDILDGNCALAIHNYCLGRPLDYPNDPITMHGQPLTAKEWEEQGGMWAWEMGYEAVNEHRRRLANPNASIMTDSTCFRAFEYFDALVQEAVGHSIPIFTTEGGYNVGQRAGTTFGDDPRYPKPTPERAGQLTDDMFRYIEEQAPDYYFACMPWLIAVSRIGIWGDAFENQGPWFTHHFDKQFGLKGELPIVPRLKARPGTPRQDGPVPAGFNNFYTGPDLAGRKFDDRLKYLKPQVYLEPVADPSQPYWKLIEVRWEDELQGGKGYIFVKVLDEHGQPVEGLTFQGDRGDAIDRIETKGRLDNYLGNYQMTATLGTYTVSINQDGLPSDRLLNVGLGNEVSPRQPVRTSFFLTFQKVLGEGLRPPMKPTPPQPPQPPVVEPPPPVITPPTPTKPALKPEPVTPPTPPAPDSLPARELDARLTKLIPPVTVTPVADPTQPHWRLVKVRWANETEAQGRTYIFVTALDQKGQPLENALFLVDRGDVVDRVTTKGPIDQYLGNYLMTAWLGTYTVSMGQDRLPSDQLINVGMGDGQKPVRTSFFLTFQKVVPVVERPVTPPPGQPPAPISSPPGPVFDEAALKAALVAASGQYIIPVNRLAALYQYAQRQKLGEFLSAEFSVPFLGVTYRAQVFERGIAYFDAAKPETIKHFVVIEES